MINNKEKQFDCIKIKDSVQAQINAETQNMSKDELLKYFNREKYFYHEPHEQARTFGMRDCRCL